MRSLVLLTLLLVGCASFDQEAFQRDFQRGWQRAWDREIDSWYQPAPGRTTLRCRPEFGGVVCEEQ